VPYCANTVTSLGGSFIGRPGTCGLPVAPLLLSRWTMLKRNQSLRQFTIFPSECISIEKRWSYNVATGELRAREYHCNAVSRLTVASPQ